jgi:hypothetical protein
MRCAEPEHPTQPVRLIVAQMVVSLRESLQKNTAAKEAAETANRSKSEFLANMVSLPARLSESP